jgi:hypothetical protein
MIDVAGFYLPVNVIEGERFVEYVSFTMSTVSAIEYYKYNFGLLST